MNKACMKCREVKHINEYSWKNQKTDTKQSQCKDCLKEPQEAVNLRLIKNRTLKRQYIYDISISRGCEKCGYNKSVAALQFDHINTDDKYMDISKMVHNNY
jgi:hypothetical protein